MVHGSSLLEMFISIISETSRVMKGSMKGSREGKLSSKEMIFSKSKSPQVTIDWHNPTTPNLNLYHNCRFLSINPNSVVKIGKLLRVGKVRL